MSTPVTVIGGYLGAGKTTLINAILRQADGARIAVLVNEFGALPIDADLILAQEGDVISIAGGCICCAFGDNLVGAVADLLALAPRPDHIVIEASGVAIPGAIAATLSLVAGVHLRGTVTLADAETVQTRACDPYMGDTILRQLDGADIVLVSKTDLVADTTCAAVHAWLGRVAPAAKVLSMVHGRVPNAVVLGALRLDQAPLAPDGEDHGSLYTSLAFGIAGLVDARAVSDVLATASFGVVRAKGFFEQPAHPPLEIHAVGTRVVLEPVAALPTHFGLVCIGLKARLQVAPLAQALAPLGLILLDPATGHAAASTTSATAKA